MEFQNGVQIRVRLQAEWDVLERFNMEQKRKTEP